MKNDFRIGVDAGGTFTDFVWQKKAVMCICLKRLLPLKMAP